MLVMFYEEACQLQAPSRNVRFLKLFWTLFITTGLLTSTNILHAYYIGVTCGWNYGGELTGPNTGT